MDNWFTVEKIDGNTFAISEYKHWEETHCYLLLGEKFSILIDTGLGVANIKKVVEGITTLPVLVMTTHIHWDHIGGHKYFNEIAVYENELEWISKKFPMPLQAVKRNLTLESCDFPVDFNIDDYNIFQGVLTHIMHNEDIIDFGNRKLKVIHTPGHSPGHCCFYEEERGYLYSGDLIYSGCLDVFYPTTDPLEFMQSINKIRTLNVKKILPAHHELNISVDLLGDIANAFLQLYEQNQLQQRNGIFDFGNFQIHL